MDVNSGRIYEDDDEIEAAQDRGEKLIYGQIETLKEIQPLLLNRAQRRERARRAARAMRAVQRQPKP